MQHNAEVGLFTRPSQHTWVLVKITKGRMNMLEMKKGIDIVSEIGGIFTHEEAMQLFEKELDETNLSKIKQIKHTEVLLKVANAIAMC
ncbi:MAG: hypothetical protein JRF60_19250, partial [Deltaproteobacteria bacterium]|nr:hypothetical protein [Deltaproteobacteria bacterium]